MDRRLWSQAAEISIQIRLELVEQNFQFRIIELAGGRNLNRIDNHGAELFHLLDAIVQELVGGIVEFERLADDSQSRAFQSVRIQEFQVVVQRFAFTRVGRGI